MEQTTIFFFFIAIAVASFHLISLEKRFLAFQKKRIDLDGLHLEHMRIAIERIRKIEKKLSMNKGD